MLTACSGTQPFDFDAEFEEETEVVDPTDPNVTVDSKFAFDREAGLTMNSVTVVENTDGSNHLLINNLPFDGPEGRYDFVSALGAGGVYGSQQTETTGQVKHYAVFISSTHIEAAAAAGEDWVNFGYGGANINRDSFSLPNDGEYVYTGDYVGVRTFEDRAGLELVDGDVRILLDVNDFDPVGGI